MRIKTKLLLSFGFLLVLILVLGFIGSLFNYKMSEGAKIILKNNYLSLEYMHNINKEVDLIAEKVLFSDIPYDFEENITALNEYLRLQERNITELNEQQATVILETTIDNFIIQLNKGKTDKELLRSVYDIKEAAIEIYEINQEIIYSKNRDFISMANQRIQIMLLFSLLAFLVVLVFVLRMPSYLTRPFHKFDRAIDQISNGKFDLEFEIDRQDEFHDLATSFKMMAARLKELEQINYSKILFEKKRLLTIINQLTEAVIGLDENKRVLFANQKALSLLGLKRKDVEGIYAPDISVHNIVMQNLIKDIMVGANDKSKGASLPLHITVGDKEKLFSKNIVEIVGSSNMENQEMVGGQIIILTDVTEFADKDKAKTFFMATLAHQLKTPIAAIDLGIELLKNKQTGTLNVEQRGWLLTVEQNNGRIRRIINEILDLSQIESGTIDIINKVSSTGQMIERAAKGVELFLKEKNLSLDLPLKTLDHVVMADSQKTIWVINNFLTNAIRYSPADGIISINVQKEGSYIKITVVDMGRGIGPYLKSIIFKAFFRNKENNIEGTGLGLAISKEFIEAMGGEIGVESEEGNGASFWIKLKNAKP